MEKIKLESVSVARTIAGLPAVLHLSTSANQTRTKGIVLWFVPEMEIVFAQMPGGAPVLIPRDSILGMVPTDGAKMMADLGLDGAKSVQEMRQAAELLRLEAESKRLEELRKEEEERMAQAERELLAQQQVVKETTPAGPVATNKYIVERDPSAVNDEPVDLSAKVDVKRILTPKEETKKLKGKRSFLQSTKDKKSRSKK